MAAVPTVAQWPLATLPKYLTPDEVKLFLDAFDRHSADGKRGYAMARCLLDMALRAGEVAAIQLDDLNWREGTVTVNPGKSRRADVLPLPAATGRAIVEYLRRARPQSTNRALFLKKLLTIAYGRPPAKEAFRLPLGSASLIKYNFKPPLEFAAKLDANLERTATPGSLRTARLRLGAVRSLRGIKGRLKSSAEF